MGIFARIAQLIKSNLNDLISRSEDPEKMLNQVVLDMNNQLVEAKKQVAASIADEKRLAKQSEQEAANAAEWERRAMMALRAGNEELAKEALARKREHDRIAVLDLVSEQSTQKNPDRCNRTRSSTRASSSPSMGSTPRGCEKTARYVVEKLRNSVTRIASLSGCRGSDSSRSTAIPIASTAGMFTSAIARSSRYSRRASRSLSSFRAYSVPSS